MNMDITKEDSDESALFCTSLSPKRKLTENKTTKQSKLTFTNVQPHKNETSKTPDPSSTEKSEPNEEDRTSAIYNESSSSYFNDTTKRVSNCPLCLKLFDNQSSYTTHMKQCAKRHKMTTEQLLNALELQKKQIKERQALGLSSQILPAVSKFLLKKKNQQEDPKSNYDLALALALSKSLDEYESKEGCSLMNHQKPTLEKFGFTTSNNKLGSSKRRNKLNKKSILKERTSEERQRIITEKVSVILLDEDDIENVGYRNINKNISINNEELRKCYNREAHLWSIGENEKHSAWYVNEMKSMLVMEKEEQKKTEERDSNQQKEEVSGKNTVKDIQNEISKLDFPKNKICQDWKKMINNDKMSDLVIRTKDYQNCHLHSLVLSVRCPQILEQDYESVFAKYNLSTCLIFFEYLYCGTLNDLTESEMNNLFNLSTNLNYSELVNVLGPLRDSLSEIDCSEGIIPSSFTPDLEKVNENGQQSAETDVMIIEDNHEGREAEEVTIVAEDKDLFGDVMVDLTQSSFGSSTVEDEGKEKWSDDETNAEKSYWSFLQHEKRNEKLEEMRKLEEEKESSLISTEMEKIETSMKQQQERMQQILDEFEKEESIMKNKLELQKLYRLQRRESNGSATKDIDDVFNNKCTDFKLNDDCIVLSSDSDTRASKHDEDPVEEKKPSMNSDNDLPYFDPYKHFSHFPQCNFSPVDLQSQSMITGDISPIKLKIGNTSRHDLSVSREEPTDTISLRGPDYCSTPVPSHRSSPRVKSSIQKSQDKSVRRRTNLAASRIIRKSLRLPAVNTSGKSNTAKKKSLKKSRKKNSLDGKNLADVFSNSIINEFSNSPLFKSSTETQSKRFVEMTPRASRGLEFSESVTPSPNYSTMAESMLKEHLAKYGLKRSLGKSKAKKILRHIYEELHPIINTKTGKLVKMLPSNIPKGKKKTNSKTTSGGRKRKKPMKEEPSKKRKSNVKETEKKQDSDKSKQSNSSMDCEQLSDESLNSLDRSTVYDSDRSEFEYLNESLTQSVPNNSVDLPSAFQEFLQLNPDFYKKILLYEPIWLEDLQKRLKESFKKHFKLSDLMDYLDQKCITFRSAAQKRNNQRRNEKKRKSPRKKKTVSTQ